MVKIIYYKIQNFFATLKNDILRFDIYCGQKYGDNVEIENLQEFELSKCENYF